MGWNMQKLRLPVFQGGMSIGFSLAPLAGEVARCGGAGTIASVGIDVLMSQKYATRLLVAEALARCVQDARAIAGDAGMIGVNIMHALQRQYADSIRGAIEGCADFIAVGAGLATDLPHHVGDADIGLVPIVSSERALRIIHERWFKRYKRLPDAVIVEGPRAGGHIGVKYPNISDDAQSLENIFPAVRDFAARNGAYPVIVAGGVTVEDVGTWIARGAAAVQMGTRFLATHESGANDAFKYAIVQCTKDDIVVSDPSGAPPGSPCGMPFRVIRHCPILTDPHPNVRCVYGFVLQKNPDGTFAQCPAFATAGKTCHCICTGLMAASQSAAGDTGAALWTVGEQAADICDICSVADVMTRIAKNL